MVKSFDFEKIGKTRNQRLTLKEVIALAALDDDRVREVFDEDGNENEVQPYQTEEEANLMEELKLKAIYLKNLGLNDPRWIPLRPNGYRFERVRDASLFMTMMCSEPNSLPDEVWHLYHNMF